MEIPSTYACLQIVKKPGEENDANMPGNLFEACIVFKGTNEIASLDKCKMCVDKLFLVLSNGPDGKSKINIGFGSLCWDCGHTGIPVFEDVSAEPEPDNLHTLFPKCSLCSSVNANMIRFVQPDGSLLPWIEVQE